MLRRQRKVVDLATVIVLIWINTNSVAESKKSKGYQCPIGFNLTHHIKLDDDPICYRLKGPEAFTDKFVECSGNLFTSKLYQNLNISKTGVKLWAEYKSLYPGGPFIDWSYTESTGNILAKTFEVKYDIRLGIDEELCTIIEPDGNLASVRCYEKYYRYCFVKPYEEAQEMSNEGCDDLKEYWRFWSPKPTCLASVSGVNGGTVRATWKQAQELCDRRGGSLLQRGWRYANNPLLHNSDDDVNRSNPLGIVMTPGDSLLWVDVEDGNNMVPDSEWNFRDESFESSTSLVALRGDAWHLVNNSFIFYDVICEKSIHLRNVSLNLTYNSDFQLGLSVNDSSVDENKIWCFSDSVIFYPSRVKISRIDETSNFVLKPLTDGYYWCIHADSKNFRVSESNKELYIRDQTAVTYLYAIKIRLKKKYNFENLDKLLRVWSKKLSDYIYWRTKYTRTYGVTEPSNGESIEGAIHKFKGEKDGYKSEESVLQILKLKRVFLDGKTALLHAQVTPEMDAVPPGEWEGLEVLYMKPTYYCKSFGSVPTLPMGRSITVLCKTYSCVGDFNEGVQWVTTVADPTCDLTTRRPVTLERFVNFTDVEVETTTISVKQTTTEINTRATNTIPSPLDANSSSEESYETNSSTTTELIEITPTETFTRDPFTEGTTESTLFEVSTVNLESEVTTVNFPYPIKPPPPPPLITTTTTTEGLPTTTITPPSPEEHLQNVMDNLELILGNDLEPVSVAVVDEAFDQVDDLLEHEDALEIPGRFLELLDSLGARADLNGSTYKSTVRSNIALLMADSGPLQPVTGLQISTRSDGAFAEDAFQILTEAINSTHLDANASEVVVHLPQSVADSERRISFVVFRNDRAFHPSQRHALYAVNSRVLSVKVENVTQFEHGETIDLHFRPIAGDITRNNSRSCAFWEFLEDGSGVWSQEGCTFISSRDPSTLDTCRCTHLTHFAEILVTRTLFSERNEKVLEILSIVGCLLSIFGILMVALTALLFRSWRRDFSNKIWLQLCIAILLLAVCFLVVVFANFQEYDVPCMLVGVALHYSVIASFCWMLVAAVLSYRRLVLVFSRDASHKLLRASAFSWGVPCAIVGVLLSVAPHSYAGRFEEMTPSGVFCYPSGLALWLAVYAPISLMLLANWTLFALIVRSVFASKRIQRHGDSNEALRCATVSCLLVFLFGLPWIFGLFASNIVGAYLFTLTATFQGFVLFIFFVVGNKKTRDLWFNKLKIKQTRKVPVTTSTFGNKSSNSGPVVGWRGGSGRVPTIEANASKPRSLASSDDSRFS